jgi:hypothetical protein
VQLYLFDLLQHDSESLLKVPYTGRRERLGDLGLDEDPVRTTPWYPGGAADIWAASLAHGLEGVVGKPLASAYHPGQRRDWIKIKHVRHAEVVICGWKPGTGRRADTIGSLLLGVRDGRELRYAGHVGTGFTQSMLTDLARQLRPLRRASSPFGTPVPAQHARDAGGWNRGWPPKSPSPSGLRTWSCAIRAGADCAPTRTLTRYTGKPESSSARPGGRGGRVGITPHCPHTPCCRGTRSRRFSRHGAARGSWLTIRRLLRCRPGTADGFDPVP